MDKLIAALGGKLGRVIGGLLGLAIGILLATFGFWWTLLILVFVVAGYFLGSTLDGDTTLQELLRRLFPTL